MSDYNYPGPEDPLRRDDIYDPNARRGNTAWGWIAAAVFLVVVLAMLFGVGHQAGQGTNTASNDTTAPATRMAPATPAPSNVPPTIATPAPTNPAPPVTPAPSPPANAPAQQH
jgi:hypothetical protein